MSSEERRAQVKAAIAAMTPKEREDAVVEHLNETTALILDHMDLLEDDERMYDAQRRQLARLLAIIEADSTAIEGTTRRGLDARTWVIVLGALVDCLARLRRRCEELQHRALGALLRREQLHVEMRDRAITRAIRRRRHDQPPERPGPW
jgi:hypothetical protein